MPSFLACFGCGSSARVAPGPPDLELSREELKAMYGQSLKLNGGRLIVHGIFARADTRNNNRRVYPMNVLKREAARFERERIESGSALGEVDHPSYNSNYFRSINLANISHQVLDIQWSGDQLLGSIEILPTPSGMLLWELYAQGIKLGVSSRGWASLRSDHRSNALIVEEDFDLITFDFVTDPSTQDAYLVPLREQYKGRLPDQSKAVLTAHLGHGTCSIEMVSNIPGAARLAQHIRALCSEFFGTPGGPKAAKGLQDLPKDTGSRVYLDQLLRYSHYIVYNDAAYLEKEAHSRDYLDHLSDFATKAHLWDMCQSMLKRDRDLIFVNARGSGCALDRRILGQSPPIGGLQPQNFGEASIQPGPPALMPASDSSQHKSLKKLPSAAQAEVARIKNTLASYASHCSERQEALRTSVFAASPR